MRLPVLIALVLAMGCSPALRLSPEAALVRSKCGACHPRPEPVDHAGANWERIHGWHKDTLNLSDEDVVRIREHLDGRIRDLTTH